MSTDLGEVHRQEWAGVVATLVRSFGDIDIAEEAAAETFATAVARWPVDGVPESPRAWLLTVARNKARDRIRRESTRDQRHLAAQRAITVRAEPTDPTDDGHLPDDRLRLVFTCCHPALSPEARIALTLRLITGLSTEEIARAFWVPVPTMAQRLVRAKKKVAQAGIPYRVPPPAELAERLDGVLRVVYLVFREGYSPSGGDEVVRVDLAEEAIRLARLVHELVPEEGEVTGLLALLVLQHSRHAARSTPGGEIILFADQDRSLWDGAAITEGTALAEAALARGRGTYALQAGIAACHATARSAGPDWRAIAALYGELARIDASPAVALSRAVAVAEVDGPGAGLAIVGSLLSTPAGQALASTSHQPHVVVAELSRRLGRLDDAAASYRRAIALAPTDADRRHLQARLADLD